MVISVTVTVNLNHTGAKFSTDANSSTTKNSKLCIYMACVSSFSSSLFSVAFSSDAASWALQQTQQNYTRLTNIELYTNFLMSSAQARGQHDDKQWIVKLGFQAFSIKFLKLLQSSRVGSERVLTSGGRVAVGTVWPPLAAATACCFCSATLL